MPEIECAPLHSELFRRRHSTRQSHGLFALAKPLYWVILNKFGVDKKLKTCMWTCMLQEGCNHEFYVHPIGVHARCCMSTHPLAMTPKRRPSTPRCHRITHIPKSQLTSAVPSATEHRLWTLAQLCATLNYIIVVCTDVCKIGHWDWMPEFNALASLDAESWKPRRPRRQTNLA